MSLEVSAPLFSWWFFDVGTWCQPFAHWSEPSCQYHWPSSQPSQPSQPPPWSPPPPFHRPETRACNVAKSTISITHCFNHRDRLTHLEPMQNGQRSYFCRPRSAEAIGLPHLLRVLFDGRRTQFSAQHFFPLIVVQRLKASSRSSRWIL